MSGRRLGTATCVLVLLLAACTLKADDTSTRTPQPTATTSATPESSPSPSAPQQSEPVTDSPRPGNPEPGLPAGVKSNPDATAGAGLSKNGKLWIITYGSSSNPLRVAGVSSQGQTITVRLAHGAGTASLDVAPSTTTMRLPEGVDDTATMYVDLGGFGQVEILPSRGTVSWFPAAQR